MKIHRFVRTGCCVDRVHNLHDSAHIDHHHYDLDNSISNRKQPIELQMGGASDIRSICPSLGRIDQIGRDIGFDTINNVPNRNLRWDVADRSLLRIFHTMCPCSSQDNGTIPLRVPYQRARREWQRATLRHED